MEIESRTGKQIRGAVLDLMMHPYPKKLLMLIPEHMNSVVKTKVQCDHTLDRYLNPDGFEVVGFEWDRRTAELRIGRTGGRTCSNPINFIAVSL